MTTRTFEGARLDDVLAEVQQALGPSATIVRADRRRSGGLFGFFARERFVVEVEVPETAEATAPADVPAPAPTATAPGGLLDLVEAASRADRAIVAGQDTGLPVPTVSTEGAGFADVLARLVQGAGSDAGTGPTPSAPEPAVLDVVPARRPAPRTDRQAEALGRLGLPELLSPGPGADTGALVERLGLLPEARALPRAGGVVIALVGERGAALALAAQLEAELVLNPERTLVATTARGLATIPPERRIGSVAAAAAQRDAVGRRQEPTLVVIDAPMSRAAAGWASHLLRALEPAAVWGVVDALRKPEDVRAWAERIGGIDALAVRGLEETESPAAVLRAGIPVARLDGQPATPLRWASLLADRLEELRASSERPMESLVA